MLEVLKAEIRYSSKFFLVMMAFIPFLVLYRFYLDEEFAFSLLPTIILMVPLIWNIQRNKEHRDCQLGRLPLSIYAVGMARMLVPLLLSLSMGLLFLLLSALIPASLLWRNLIVWYIIMTILLIFSIYFILRDSLLYFLRHNRYLSLSKENMIMLILGMVILLNLLGLYLFITENQGVVYLIGQLMKVNPFSGESGLGRLIITSMIMALVSVYTFSRRKTYLE
jgi:hypothetical protein